jgi:hypothetical protein
MRSPSPAHPILPALTIFFLGGSALAQPAAEQGAWFAKKAYEPKPLPKLEETRGKLPAPVYEDDPTLAKMYWKAWELAFRNFHEPATNSGFVPSSSTPRSTRTSSSTTAPRAVLMSTGLGLINPACGR